MADSAAIWKLHVIYRLSHVPARFDDDVQCSSWTNRPYARWRSPPWLASRLHQGRCMSAPRPNPSLREGVTPAMLHPRVRHVPATTERQGVLLREGLVVAALLLAL